MKVILLAVTSLDGYITRASENDIYVWTSSEDSKLFFKEIERASLIFMGAKTYETAKHLMKHKTGRTRIIFTRNPKKYIHEEISGLLEFTSQSPQSVIARFEKQGITKALLVGGSEINSKFLANNLISEMRITIEPVLFGSGKKLFLEGSGKIFQLISCKKLNKTGTLLVRYNLLTEGR